MSDVTIPAGADLRQLRTQAKDLRRGVHRGVPEQVAAFARHHPRGTELTARDDARRQVTLRDAQLALARGHGFAGWQEFVAAVGGARVEERDMHRWFGVELNNEVWDLLDAGVAPDSPRGDRDLVLYGAYASARHWHEVGTVAHAARGEHLIARAALAVGEAAVGLAHARRCLELVESHPDEMADWDAPFAHEALARALAATGDPDGAQRHLDAALELAAAVADPDDRAVLDDQLARGPWFGLPTLSSP